MLSSIDIVLYLVYQLPSWGNLGGDILFSGGNSLFLMCQSENRSSKTTEAWMESAYIPLDSPKVVMSVGTMP